MMTSLLDGNKPLSLTIVLILLELLSPFVEALTIYSNTCINRSSSTSFSHRTEIRS
jgi:hypothetical protein